MAAKLAMTIMLVLIDPRYSAPGLIEQVVGGQGVSRGRCRPRA